MLSNFNSLEYSLTQITAFSWSASTISNFTVVLNHETEVRLRMHLCHSKLFTQDDSLETSKWSVLPKN